jgi:hypothetical protein
MGDTIKELEAAELLETPFDAADPEAVNDARKKAGRRKTKRLEFVKAMMVLEEGRKWLWELMESCHIHSNPLVPNDTHSTYFNLGEQNIGKRVLSDVQHFPELYVKMCNENK